MTILIDWWEYLATNASLGAREISSRRIWSNSLSDFGKCMLKCSDFRIFGFSDFRIQYRIKMQLDLIGISHLKQI